MIVAQRKIQFKTDSRQKKRQNYVVMKLNCKNVFVKSINDYTRKFKHMKLVTIIIDLMFAQMCVHYVCLVIILLCTLKGWGT
jgi:hypothetical protein